ncbi:relaxase/mobilization nuclease domain-containing protein [Limosilactobacillus agrestimuris]|uniref:relaxase/mobilization nuclease domain-containing protein n=1 Tax=Limosilactobacillus agrestimuris TaxID=2941331 RepID=UPI0020424F6D|nr:relaxase/mobilization nuclease domain-containing protein [Limosilactobacillus agrestimuris]
MSVLETHSCQHSYNRLKYIFNEPAHSYQKTSRRVLATTGFNIRMLHNRSGRISTTQSGAYLEHQFKDNLQRAHNPQRRYQAQSIIVSFDPSEFDTINLQRQSQQALQLVQLYVQKHFADAQSVIAIQADGSGGKLHAHILINTIKPNGKTVPTNRFNIHKIRKDFDQMMYDNYQYITGQPWSDPIHNNLQYRQDQNNLTSRSAWQASLKKLINQLKQEATSIKSFLVKLSDHGVTVTERQHSQAWTYHQYVKTEHGTKELKVRDFYQRVDKRTGEVKSTRGLGKDFTKSALEHYFQPSQQDETEEDKHDIDETSELVKLKTMAADARFRARQKQSINQLNRQRLQAAQVEEQKQRAQRQTRENQRKRREERRFEELSRQRRRRQAARRRQSEQRTSQKSTGGPEL